MLPATDAQLRGTALLAPIALLSIGPYLALWGVPTPAIPTDVRALLLFGVAFVAGVVCHEVLHGLGHMWGRASWSNVEFGMHWRALTPYARCTVPTRARTYRVALALPALMLGGIPLCIGLVTGNWPATFFGFLMLVAAAGDLLILWILRGIPGRAWVQDHPHKVGALVAAGPEAAPPAPISEDDLSEEDASNTVSFVHLLLLATLSAVGAAIGFLIALG